MMINSAFLLNEIKLCSIDNIMATNLASVYAKDKKGNYLDVNQLFHRFCGYSTSDILGKTDQDLQWSNEAPIMMNNDQVVVCQTSTLIAIEFAKIYDGSIQKFLSHKIPLINSSKKIIGVFGMSFPLRDTNYSNENNYPSLTQRQIDCLVHLVKGMTMKQIGKELNLSYKTIEHYLEAIKMKLNCFNRTELIINALKIPAIKDRL